MAKYDVWLIYISRDPQHLMGNRHQRDETRCLLFTCFSPDEEDTQLQRYRQESVKKKSLGTDLLTMLDGKSESSGKNIIKSVCYNKTVKS